MRNAGGLSPAKCRPQGIGATFFAKLVLVKTGKYQNILDKHLIRYFNPAITDKKGNLCDKLTLVKCPESLPMHGQTEFVRATQKTA